MKRILLLLLIGLIAVPSAMAVPRLQIYIDADDVVYDEGTQTWVTMSSEFDVWVIASHLDKGTIYDIGLVAALGPDADPFDGSLSITPEGGTETVYTGSDFEMGTPPDDNPLPSHGIYPTYNMVLPVAASTPTDPNDWIEVQDWIDGDDGGLDAHGYMYKYTFSTTYTSIHLDAFGYYYDTSGKRVFAPFSHDGDYNPVPEPTTMVLLGIGLAGAGIRRRFKKQS